MRQQGARGGRPNNYYFLPTSTTASSSVSTARYRTEMLVLALERSTKSAVTVQQRVLLYAICSNRVLLSEEMPGGMALYARLGAKEKTDATLYLKLMAGLTTGQISCIRAFLDSHNIQLLSSNYGQMASTSRSMCVPIVLHTFSYDRTKDGKTQKHTCVVGIIESIQQLLLKILEVEKLTDHAVSSGNLRVKLGLDKGSSFVKLCLQVVDVSRHNSAYNTYLIGMYEGHDDYEPLRSAFSTLNSQLHSMQSSGLVNQGMRYTVAFFLSADIPALQCTLGLSVNGRCFCPFCLITKDNLSVVSYVPAFPPRTLAGMASSLAEFSKTGSLADRTAASAHGNVITPQLFPAIALENVCLPELHISLGVFKRFADLQENLLTEVDILRSGGAAPDPGSTSLVLQQFRKLLKKRASLKEDVDCWQLELNSLMELKEIAMLEETDELYHQQLILRISEKNAASQAVQAQLASVSLECSKIVKKIPKGDGTMIQSFAGALKSLGIQVQAYHSQCFIGSHVQKGFQGRKSLFHLIRSQANCPPCFHAREQKLAEVVEAFHSVRELYTSNRPLDENEILFMESGVTNFQRLYTESFGTLTPKMHMLSHMPQFARLHGSIGVFTEQGVESVHPFVNAYKRRHSYIKNQGDFLEMTMREQQLSNLARRSARSE